MYVCICMHNNMRIVVVPRSPGSKYCNNCVAIIICGWRTRDGKNSFI